MVEDESGAQQLGYNSCRKQGMGHREIASCRHLWLSDAMHRAAKRVHSRSGDGGTIEPK